MRYRSKPSEVDAVQWTADNSDECYQFCKSRVRVAFGELELKAGKDGAQDWVPVPIGHWLVCQPGDKSDIWPVDPEYFASKYDEVPEPRTVVLACDNPSHSMFRYCPSPDTCACDWTMRPAT